MTDCVIQFPTTTTITTTTITMSTPATSLTATQIHHRANDYDSQIRQGLEDGSVRQVVKRLGKDLVSLQIIIVLMLTYIELNLDGVVDPSPEGDTKTSGCIPEALVFVPVRSGLEY